MRLRLATQDDAEAVRGIYAPFVADTPISFEVQAPDVAEMARRIATAMPAYPFLVADDGGQVVGYAYAGPHNDRAAYRWSANVSVYVDPSRHRTGIGRSLYRALLALLAAQGYRQAIAGITLPNAGSVGIHEAAGFTIVGIYRQVGWKLGAWHDVSWWQLTLEGSDGPGRETRPVDQLDLAVVAQALQA